VNGKSTSTNVINNTTNGNVASTNGGVGGVANLMRNASKSCDNNINKSTSCGINGAEKNGGLHLNGNVTNSGLITNGNAAVTHSSSTTSNLNNSHASMFEASCNIHNNNNNNNTGTTTTNGIRSNSFKTNSLVALTTTTNGHASSEEKRSESESVVKDSLPNGTADANNENDECIDISQEFESHNGLGQLVVNGHVYDNNSSFKLSLTADESLQSVTNGAGVDGNSTTNSTTTTTTIANNNNNTNNNHLGPQVLSFQVEIDDSRKRRIDEKLRECSSGDSDSESEHNIYMPKAVDLPSAQRLAKRLYYLDGFKANDVVRHLSKKYAPFFSLL
jgi:hypothetical protein